MAEPADLDNLIADLESDRMERTTSRTDTDKHCRAICAFANDMPGHGKSGYLFIGVDDQGQPSGEPVDDDLITRLSGYRNNGTILPIPTITVFCHRTGAGDVAVVQVEPSDMPPVRYKETVWIRVGSTQNRATPEQERRLNERRVDRAQTWDLRACRGASLEDLAVGSFSLNYLPSAISRETIDENNRPIEHQLSALRFWRSDFGCPTNAGVLVFGSNPLGIFAGAYVQFVAYDGPNQSDPVLEERRYSGDLLTVLRQLDELALTMARIRPERDGTMRERDVADYPPLALRELFMNAVIHRNYNGSTAPVSINLYSDRVEVYNPGGLYGDMAKDQLFVGTAYRNPVLAEAAKILGYVNKFGRGLDIVRDELETNGSLPLEPTVGDSHMLMLVRNRP